MQRLNGETLVKEMVDLDDVDLQYVVINNNITDFDREWSDDYVRDNLKDDFLFNLQEEVRCLKGDLSRSDKRTNKEKLEDLVKVEEYMKILSGEEKVVRKDLFETFVTSFESSLVKREDLLREVVSEDVGVVYGDAGNFYGLEVFTVTLEDEEVFWEIEDDLRDLDVSFGEPFGADLEVNEIKEGYYRLYVPIPNDAKARDLLQVSHFLKGRGERNFINPETFKKEDFSAYWNENTTLRSYEGSVEVFIGELGDVYVFDKELLEHEWYFDDMTEEERNLAMYDAAYLVNYSEVQPLVPDSDGFAKVNSKDVLYFKDIGDIHQADCLPYVDKFDVDNTRTWLKIAQSNGEFEGHPEDVMNFDNTPPHELQYYFDEWIDEDRKREWVENEMGVLFGQKNRQEKNLQSEMEK